MSLWIKRDVLLPRNRKTYRLAELLAQGGGTLFGDRDEVAWRAIAIVVLEQFWAHVVEHYPAGDVTDAPKAELSDALMPWLSGTEWAVQDVRILLEKSGHVVRTRRGRLIVRDWLEWTGSDALRLAKDRKRKRMERARRPRTRPHKKEGRGAGKTALAEKSRAETTSSSPSADAQVLRANLTGPAVEIFEGLLRAAHNPPAAAAVIRSYGPDGIDGRYTWAEIGQALLEMAASNLPFTARMLAACLRKVHEGEPPARGHAPALDESKVAGDLARAELARTKGAA